MFSSFSRQPELNIEREVSPSLLAEQDAFNRIVKVRNIFGGLLKIFPDEPVNKILDDGVQSGRRVWLHHYCSSEFGGGILNNGTRTYFGWVRQDKFDMVTVGADHEDNILYQLHMAHQSLKMLAGSERTTVYGERGKQGIERLERIAATFGELAFRSV